MAKIMKHTQKIELRRTLKQYSFSFLSISLIVALGIIAFLGIWFTSVGIKNMGNHFYQNANFSDFQIIGVNGFQQNEIDQLKEIDGVKEAEGIYKTQAVISLDSVDIVGEFFTQSDNINIVEVLEGNLPSGSNECAIESMLAKSSGLSVGDTISLHEDNEMLSASTYYISAIVNLPQLFCDEEDYYRGISDLGSGQVQTYVLVDESSFYDSSFGGVYTSAYVTIDKPQGMDLFSKKYLNLSSDIKGHIQEWLDVSSKRSDGTVLLDANANVSFYTVFTDVLTLKSIAFTCSLLFILVAAIVSYTTVERIICEQKKIIGIQKSMGMKNSYVFTKYFICCFLAVMFGVIIGVFTAYFYVQNFIFKIGYENAYMIHRLVRAFDYKVTFLVVVGELVCVILPAYLACKKLMKMPAVELMDSNISGISKPIILERVKIFGKTMPQRIKISLRNVFANKKMLLATVTGVIGCTTIVGAVFTVRFAIGGVATQQYDVLQQYDTVVMIDTGLADSDIQTLEEKIDAMPGIEYLSLCSKFVLFHNGNTYNYVTLLGTNDERFGDYFKLMDADTENLITIPEDGILVARKLAENYNLQAGDSMTLYNSDGTSYEAEVRGVFENYIGYSVIISPVYYEKMNGKALVSNCFYLKTGDVGISGIKAKLLDEKAVMQIKGADEYRDIFARKVSNSNMVILFILVLALLLTVVVLLNLMVMNIMHKQREIAVLTILGFSRRKVATYLLREGLLMLLMGLVIGGGSAALTGSYISKAIELETIQYIRGISLPACFMAIGISAIYTMCVNLIAMRKLRKIDITDLDK